MDRANAAQLASRNIKAAKLRRKTPIRSDAAIHQSMSFQGGAGGGLFGGSVQAPSTFNFAPSGGPSFPPSNFPSNPFGNASSTDVSDNEDPRADTTGEEALRRRRGFQQDPDSALQKSNPFNQPNHFGQPQEESATPSFAFGQSQSAGPGMFGQGPAQATTNLFAFGASQPTPSSPGINFGAGPTQDKAASDIFSGFGQQTTQSTAPVFNFASTDKPATPQFPFGSSSMQFTNPGINFGAAPAREQPANNIFGTTAASSSNPPNQFNSIEPTSNIFGNVGGVASSGENRIFGMEKQQSTSTNNPFGEQSQPAQNISNIFGNVAQTPSRSVFENSQSTSGTNIFGGFSKPSETAATPFHSSNQQPASTSNVFGGLEKPKTPANDLFGHLNKPLDQPVPSPKVNGTSGNVIGAETGKSSTDGVSAPFFPSQGSSSNLFGAPKPLFSPAVTQAEAPAARSNSPFSFESTPTFAETNGNTSASPLKPIDASTIASQPTSKDVFPSFLAHPVEPSNGSTMVQNTTTVSAPNSFNGVTNGNATQDIIQSPASSAPLLVPELSDNFLYSLAPATFTELQRQEFCTAYRLRSLNKVMAEYFSSVPVTLEISGAIAHYTQERMDILHRSSIVSSSLKRKASEDENEENENPTKRNKPLESWESSQSPNNPQAPKSLQSSSATLFESQPVSNGNATTNAPPFPTPQLYPQAPAESQSTKGKRKAEKELTKDDYEKGEREIKRLNMNGGSTGSNTSNIFKNILESPAMASPGKKIKPLPENSKQETPKFNPFGSLHVPPPPATSTTSPVASSTTSNIFAPIPTPVPAATNIFAPKSVTPSTETSAPKSTIKPPNFGSSNGPVNFLAQFGQKATKDTSKAEEKLMEEAKGLDDDFDSDDEEAWEARYKEKRKEQLKAAEAALEESKSKRATFIPGQGFSFVPTTPIPVPSDAGMNNSVFSSLNGSRTPTPSIFGKPSDNIFGHLASEPPSGKDDDTEDDSAGEESDDDSENVDPTFQPGKETSSPGSPGTPAEETGAGIASAKKTTPFSLGPHKVGLFDPSRTGTPSGSGTTTPGGLFDRITKDANGNAMRQLPSDEKENTQPSTTTNIFSDIANPFSSSFSKTSDLPADQTWQKDSPIRFGSATPRNDTSNPKVNVIAATPTKATPFTNLFGNSNTFKPALSSAGVGFSFGGASSNVPSLFPSAAVSASTSRATSPGGTTDGDSAAEGGDPDVEKHEQINLATGGPGEEDEEVLFEARAKATIFVDGDWQSKGLGPVRVLKHKETSATRILLRADPSGKIILNKSLLSQNYKATAKTVKLTAAGELGTLETWLLQVKTPESAEQLAKVLEDNKPA